MSGLIFFETRENITEVEEVLKFRRNNYADARVDLELVLDRSNLICLTTPPPTALPGPTSLPHRESAPRGPLASIALRRPYTVPVTDPQTAGCRDS